MVRKIILFVAIAMLFINQSMVYGEGDKTANINNSKSSIIGKIVDNSNGEPLAGVTVFVQGTDIRTYSDLDGNFSFKIEPGKYDLMFSMISYKNSIIDGMKLYPNEKENLEVKLIILK